MILKTKSIKQFIHLLLELSETYFFTLIKKKQKKSISVDSERAVPEQPFRL
jgi:hypothetical protein